ncbi:hypothetical protein [Bacillus sp. REN16]|nr:hypothetical protein [Bacillus sp. REN16]MCC3356762.1 hypothetical protein [Bacillus sp. REN16]
MSSPFRQNKVELLFESPNARLIRTDQSRSVGASPNTMPIPTEQADIK